jgi:riboflavin-specific deaminase-like protein
MKRPYVTLSYAQSVDGRLATKTGHSQWISGPETLLLSQEHRRDNDAILVGISTVLIDNPRLTCRIAKGVNPLRVILDSRFRTPGTKHVCDKEAPTVVFGKKELIRSESAIALALAGVDVQGVQSTDQGLDLSEVLNILYEVYHVKGLYVEGGKGVLTSFFHFDLVDRAQVVIAPMVIGQGLEAIGDLGIDRIDQAKLPLETQIATMGKDLVMDMIFRHREEFS